MWNRRSEGLPKDGVLCAFAQINTNVPDRPFLVWSWVSKIEHGWMEDKDRYTREVGKVVFSHWSELPTINQESV